MARPVAQYRVDCLQPGLNIPGAGALFKKPGSTDRIGHSIIPPGTVLNASPAFEPHACMTPLNNAAKEAFKAKKVKWEKAWRESLAKSQTPDGRPIDAPTPLSKEYIEDRVKRELLKCGPNGPVLQTEIKKKRPVLAAGFSIEGDAAAEADEIEDAGDEPRASDAE